MVNVVNPSTQKRANISQNCKVKRYSHDFHIISGLSRMHSAINAYHTTWPTPGKITSLMQHYHNA